MRRSDIVVGIVIGTTITVIAIGAIVRITADTLGARTSMLAPAGIGTTIATLGVITATTGGK